MAGNNGRSDSPYAPGYVAPEAYESYDTQQEVMNHLLFYKAIIDDKDASSGQKIDEYMDMIARLQDGMYVPIRDPFNRAIALTFELVIQNQLNPWNVNLVKFAELYIKRNKDEDYIDFITAGKIMVMAWEILKRQTEQVLSQAAPEDDNPPDMDAGIEGADWMADDAGFDFTTKVLDSEAPPLDEPIRHCSERKVTLFELVEAFEEARKEAEVMAILESERAKERDRLSEARRDAVSGMMHKEDLAEDIANTWKRIEPLDGEVPFCNVCHLDDMRDRIASFVSILFLAREGKIRVWQKGFPSGEIFLRKVTEEERIALAEADKIWKVKEEARAKREAKAAEQLAKRRKKLLASGMTEEEVVAKFKDEARRKARGETGEEGEDGETKQDVEAEGEEEEKDEVGGKDGDEDVPVPELPPAAPAPAPPEGPASGPEPTTAPKPKGRSRKKK